MTLLIMRRCMTALAVAAVVSTAACGGDEGESTGGQNGAAGSEAETEDTAESVEDGSADQSEQKYPDIVEVEVDKQDNQTASFSVTVSSPYDTPQRYADGWRVLDQDGEVLGEHTLGHDHASEQPFTRTQSDVAIPEGTTELTIEGRDQANGYGGDTVSVDW